MKIKFDKRFVLEEAYQKYLYMLKYMPGDSRHSPSTNYRKPGIADVEGYPGTPGSDYPLYGYFASLVSATTILEIGTYQGGSAVMMSSNESNRIITYDVVDFIPGKVNRSNIEFRVGNFMRANYFIKKLITMQLI